MIGVLEVQREDDVKEGVEHNCSVRKRGIYDDDHKMVVKKKKKVENHMGRARKIHGVNGT